MKGMASRRNLAVFIAISVFVAACAPGSAAPTDSLFQTGHVTIGVKYDQPGTGFLLNGTRSGFDIDLAQYLSQALHVIPSFVDTIPGNRLPYLENGVIQLAIATFSMTQQREQDVAFVGPYMTTPQGIMVRADEQINTLSELRGKNVCAPAGSTSVTFLQIDKIPTTQNATIGGCIQELLAGTVAAVSTDQIILYGFMNQYPSLRVVPGIKIGALNYYGIGLQKGHPGDCESLVGLLRAFITGGQWSQDFRQDLPAAVQADSNWQNDFKPDPETVTSYSC